MDETFYSPHSKEEGDGGRGVKRSVLTPNRGEAGRGGEPPQDAAKIYGPTRNILADHIQRPPSRAGRYLKWEFDALVSECRGSELQDAVLPHTKPPLSSSVLKQATLPLTRRYSLTHFRSTCIYVFF
ncbi:hypothetical protein BgiBS90_029220 [Biomphalaria glabrata]|nr:hypothetical protein BgiBS90_029220 [Biomphalaria glabrata]